MKKLYITSLLFIGIASQAQTIGTSSLNPNSRWTFGGGAGIGFCETYDIVEYPTIVALSDSGQLQNQWRGLPLPTISEVSYYVQSN